MLNTNSPNISVILPVYNSEEFIEKCLNSIIEQSFTDFEVIVINDSSTDKSSEIIEKYATKDNRIKVIHNTVNEGSSISRKIGLNKANGLYIQFIDSDDWIERNMFERLYQTAISGNFDIVWHDFFDFKNNYRKQNIFNLSKIELFKHLLDTKSDISSALWNKFTKKSIISDVHFAKSMQWEDLVISAQSINNAVSIKYLPEAFYHHVYNSDSISQNTERRIKGLKEIISNLSFIIDFLKEKLISDFMFLEPELSACVNRVKYEAIRKKEIRNSILLTELYPESIKNIFNKSWDYNFIKKLILYGYGNNFPGINFLLNLLK